MDPFYFTIASLALIGIVLILPIFISSRRASAELNLKPLWQKRCAGRMGALGTGIPSIRVSLYQDFMVVACLGQRVIPYRDIAEVSAKGNFWSLNFSGVTLKLRGISPEYRFHLNRRDAEKLVNLIEARLPNY